MSNQFGVQTGALTPTIYVGSLDKSGTHFASKEDQTGSVLRAVMEYVENHHGGEATIHFPGGESLHLKVGGE